MASDRYLETIKRLLSAETYFRSLQKAETREPEPLAPEDKSKQEPEPPEPEPPAPEDKSKQ